MPATSGARHDFSGNGGAMRAAHVQGARRDTHAYSTGETIGHVTDGVRQVGLVVFESNLKQVLMFDIPQ